MSVLIDPLPSHKVHRVLCGTSIRKAAVVLEAHLQTLAWQHLPPNVTLDFAWVVDTDDAMANAVLDRFGESHPTTLFRGAVGPQDTDDQHPVTHQWSPSGMARVGQNKNHLLRYAVERGYDAVWLVDADLLLDRITFASLWACRAPIACAVYWTPWQAGLSAAPQVWLNHPYDLQGRGYEAGEFRKQLLERQRIEVWGQGACTLIRKEVIEKGVNFDYIPGVTQEGMMAGEDRHFCLRAEGLHIPMMADAWPDLFHVYHPRDVEEIDPMLRRLDRTPTGSPQLGDLVEATLELLEPALQPNGQAFPIPPYFYRGRLGQGMLPELEEALVQMQAGETRTIGLHYPSHFPVGAVRGQRRLLKITLVDHKPYGFPPVVEQELLRGTVSKAMADRTTLSQAQQHAIQEDAA